VAGPWWPGCIWQDASLGDLHLAGFWVRRATAQPAQQPCQGRDGDHSPPGDQGRLGCVGLRHGNRAGASEGGGCHCGQDSAYRPQPAIEAQFTEEGHALKGGRREGARGRENSDGNAEIGAVASLGQAGRGQADRDPPLWPLLPAADDRCPDPVFRLAQRRVWQADQEHSPGWPFSISASISTPWPSTPARATEWVLATGI